MPMAGDSTPPDVIYVDNLDFRACLHVFTLQGKVNRLEVRYLNRGSWAGLSENLLHRFGHVAGVEEVTPNLGAESERGGSMWDQVHSRSIDVVSSVRDRILEGANAFEELPLEIDPDRREALVRKDLQRDLTDALIPYELAREAVAGGGAEKGYALADLGGLGPSVGDALPDDPVEVANRSGGYVRTGKRLLVFLIKQMVYLLRSRGRENPSDGASPPPSVIVRYTGGFDRDSMHPELRRYPNPDIPPERVVVLFDRQRNPATDGAVTELEDQGHRYRIPTDATNQTASRPTDSWPPKSPGQIWADLKAMGRIVRGAPHLTAPSWELWEAAVLLDRVREWQNLMREENAQVVLHTEETGMDPISLAGDEEGAVRLGFHWSDLLIPNGKLVPLQQIYTVWGPHHRAVTTDGNGAPGDVVEIGCLFSRDGPEENSTAHRYREELEGAGAEAVFAVLDRSMGLTSMHGRGSHERFFDALLTLVEDEARIGLLVKPKEEDGPAIAQVNPEIRDRLRRLRDEGCVRVLPAERSVLEAGAASDLVVALGHNSGGVVTGIAGEPVVFWEPVERTDGPFGDWIQRAGRENDKLVFRDLDILNRELRRYANEERDPDLGDFSEARPAVDPFEDGRGFDRLAFLIRSLIEAADDGLSSDEALERTLDAYGKRWGRDHVETRNER